MATELQIDNLALRLLGSAPVTQANLDDEDNEQARILNDVYDMILDEVLAAHPWNFAIKRAELTNLGGAVATWTASGTTNVWQAALTTEPAEVEFDGTQGTEKTSIAACTAAHNWFWASNVLYVYSTSDPDTAFTEVRAIIPEFEWTYAYSLPSDCLRIIKAVDGSEDDIAFVREEARLLADVDEVQIQYIAQITDTTKWTPAFIAAFAARLAAEMAFSLTNSDTKTATMYKLYLEKLRIAKGVDAQEGTGQKEESLSWEENRE